MILDSHAHIMTGDITKYPPTPLGGTLRPGELDDPMTAEGLIAEMDRNGVSRAMAVQRAYVYGFDNSYVIHAARTFPDRLSAVCAIDARDPSSLQRMKQWAGDEAIVGVRLTEPYKGSGAGWFASDEAAEVWRLSSASKLPVCLHFFRWNRVMCLDALWPVLDRFPEAPIVIDHLSNIAVEAGPPDFGIDDAISPACDRKNVSLKVTTINFERLSTARIDPARMIERLVAAFGSDRLIWGSDVAQSKGSYGEMIAAARAATAGLSPEARDRVLFGNAARLYGVAAADNQQFAQTIPK
jgi:L-fuconolactonase